MTASSSRKIRDEIASVGFTKLGASDTYSLGRTRIFGVYCSLFRVVQLFVELLITGAIFAVVLVYSRAAGWEGAIYHVKPLKLSIALCIIFMTWNCCMGMYNSNQSERSPLLLRRISLSFVFSLISVLLLFWLIGVPLVYVKALILPAAIAYLFVYLGRVLTEKYHFNESITKKVLVLGDGEYAERVFDQLYAHSEGAYSLHRLSESDCASSEQFTDQLLSFASTYEISEIVLAYTDRRKKLPMPELIDCKLSGIAVRNPAEFLERESGFIHFEFLDMGWFIGAEGFNNDVVGRIFKRLIDVIGSVVLLVLTLPIFLLACVAIKLDKSSPGPVFYRQVRVGLHGKLFKVMKFRSMCTDAEADGKPQWASENDCRVTRVGAILRKYRVDELPQLFNVLIGEMSLVGPRPERPEFVSELSDLHVLYAERHRVLPGLTGWAQMRFPYTANANDSIKKLQYDMYYVKNRSWLLDVLILLQTVEVVFCGKGAR